MISETTLENIKAFEQHMKTLICKNAINNGFFGTEDVSAYVLPRVSWLSAKLDVSNSGVIVVLVETILFHAKYYFGWKEGIISGIHS